PDEEEDFIHTWEALQREKMRGPYKPYTGILQESFREALAQFGYRCAAYAEEAFVSSVGQWEPFPDVNPALVSLAQRFRLAIVSNVDRQILGWTLRRLQVRFDALITAEDVRLYNPNPEVFRYALEKVSCAPQEMVYVVSGSEAKAEIAAAAA